MYSFIFNLWYIKFRYNFKGDFLNTGNRLQDKEEKNTQLIRISEEEGEDHKMKLSVLTLTILILVSVGVSIALVFVILYKLQRRNYIFKSHPSSCNHQQPMNLISSSTTKFQRVLSRVGKSFNENHNSKFEDRHLSSSSNSKNPMGHHVPSNKCQKVLIATTAKNGMVENRSICSNKINNSRSCNSLTVSNCTTTEEDEDAVSPKSVLLNYK